ncbi:hypothetical protein A6R68_20438 [Neotoma lepida]|uniref:WAP four-disulfide core domain protein 2 n=1 Tax=Neotoma lepida TaxID=56216 RepID=A0A1A6HSU9_NEOLE|nr:hypothetical protein A6R68_20438 [Neotoma lepida]
MGPSSVGAEKPGVCPQLQESTTVCVKECSSDNHCLDNLKCCQAGCSFVCSTPNGNPSATWQGQGGAAEGCERRERTGSGKKGTPDPGTREGLNEEELQSTTPSANHISPSERGQVSTAPPPPAVAVEEDNLEKQGTCPSVDFPKLGICEDQCQVDSQCPGNMKCCRNGCGKMTCTTPKF